MLYYNYDYTYLILHYIMLSYIIFVLCYNYRHKYLAFYVSRFQVGRGALNLLLEARTRSVRTALHPTVANLAEEARRGAEQFRPFWDVAPSRRTA